MTTTHPVRARRHTLYFLEYAARQRPVFLDTDVDMGAVHAHRAAAERRYSTVTYVLYAAGRVLHRHPEANAVLAPRRLRAPRIVRFPSVTGKLALDAKSAGGERVVLSALIPVLESATLDSIQDQVDRYRSPDVATLPEFGGVRALVRLPVWLGRAAFAHALRSARRRPSVLGTVSVSSLGHRPVDGFHSTGGTAVTLTCGRTTPRPVVREDGTIEAAPVMRLGLAFDHRVLDGAAAADVLGELTDALEHGSWEATSDAPPRLAPVAELRSPTPSRAPHRPAG
ncbi:2-oxo acid dehydrogenase subunit E2 [Streptomyces sp. DG2A-72]|uniref:2-oxo acid dehydrogenase subunit E2 n=1 Tax=Streptomyces sp. DG2A-72 TaxID=3051386 RepID=UPI00265BC935|nr:2-oxo acid dehydrogenase subunit E2 [Streptomyces sp. DG2A-72]MDO0931749.1 2-oxo acid dehydrogenase subunit E2 [Streptomyces sp. DG2A-72]